METLKANVDRVHQTIEEACYKSERDASEVQLVAVTKSTDIDHMRRLYDLGERHFAENRSDQLLERQEALADIADEIHWHFIGRLQSRKVKDIVNQVEYIHSLDRLSLAKEINKRARKPVKCFVQVNVSQEASKTGFPPELVEAFIQELAEFPHITVVGLMTMAPYDASKEDLRTYFQQMKHLQTQIAEVGYPHAPCQALSMGMSQDYAIAVEEGATMVRVGTTLFEGA